MPRSSNTGVYPVEIELRDPESGERVASFVTQLVAVAPAINGAPMGEPLNVAWIWKIAADPATHPGGALRPGFVQTTGPNGRLTRLASAAAHAVNLPLTLVPGPETLESWAQHAKTDPAAAPGLTALRAAARTKQIAHRSLRPDRHPEPGASRSGRRRRARAGAGLGRARATPSTCGSTRARPTSHPSTPPRSARLDLSQVDRLVVPPDALVAPDQTPQFTPARPFTLESGGRQFSTVQTDDGLEHLLEGDGSPALRAAHFIAGLSIVAIEQPNETRGVAIAMPAALGPGAGPDRRAGEGAHGQPARRARSPSTSSSPMCRWSRRATVPSCASSHRWSPRRRR